MVRIDFRKAACATRHSVEAENMLKVRRKEGILSNEKQGVKNISILLQQKCTGCFSCALSCPKQCISMQENGEGFFYPIVDTEKCVECEICVKKCPILTPVELDWIKPSRYALILKDGKVLLNSSSGGLFSGIASYFLENNGIVFGAAYDENLNVHTIGIESKDELYKIQGSKYVACNTEQTFEQAKYLLQKKKFVLYSGSPCQIAGLRSYLNHEYENLYTMDLICHGVPSAKLFRKYLDWLGKKYNGKIIYYGFRDKDVAGWSCGGKTKTKTKTIEGICDPYYASFLRCESYRESCYVCPFAKSKERVGDITMGDFWGTDKDYPEIPKINGISFCSVNTFQGKKIFEYVKEKFNLYECPKDEILKINIAYNHPSERPLIRDSIYNGIDGNLNKYFKSFKTSNYLKVSLKKMLSFILPKPVKNLIKKLLGKN